MTRTPTASADTLVDTLTAALVAATNELIAARDCFHECATLPDGTYGRTDDRTEVERLNAIIAACCAALAAAGGAPWALRPAAGAVCRRPGGDPVDVRTP